MTHSDHIALIQKAISLPAGIWADLGSGEGAFTLALADLGKETIEIYSVDKAVHSLVIQEELFKRRFPDAHIHFLDEDFTAPLSIPKLDGILMANSLHFIAEKEPVLTQLKTYLKPNGKFILVEYNADRGNIWVPYPLSFEAWKKMAPSVGFTTPEHIGHISSDFLNEIYASVCYNREI
jgi:ubiquinone/menaquinone biosynthesis C-methylase UbiE